MFSIWCKCTKDSNTKYVYAKMRTKSHVWHLTSVKNNPLYCNATQRREQKSKKKTTQTPCLWGETIVFFPHSWVMDISYRYSTTVSLHYLLTLNYNVLWQQDFRTSSLLCSQSKDYETIISSSSLQYSMVLNGTVLWVLTDNKK